MAETSEALNRLALKMLAARLSYIESGRQAKVQLKCRLESVFSRARANEQRMLETMYQVGFIAHFLGRQLERRFNGLIRTHSAFETTH